MTISTLKQKCLSNNFRLYILSTENLVVIVVSVTSQEIISHLIIFNLNGYLIFNINAVFCQIQILFKITYLSTNLTFQRHYCLLYWLTGVRY